MIPATTTRVPENTAECVNDWIHHRTLDNIARAAAGGPGAIDRRLRELDEEWDVERTLEANAAGVILTGMALGLLGGRRYRLLSAAAAGFLLQHAIQGWCPPLPILRGLGFRTASEIASERYALKAIRGDFKDVPAGEDNEAVVENSLEAVNA